MCLWRAPLSTVAFVIDFYIYRSRGTVEARPLYPEIHVVSPSHPEPTLSTLSSLPFLFISSLLALLEGHVLPTADLTLSLSVIRVCCLSVLEAYIHEVNTFRHFILIRPAPCSTPIRLSTKKFIIVVSTH